MSLRIYTVNGRKATFNKDSFKQLLIQKVRKERTTISKIEQRIADDLKIAANTVHKWTYNGGGPIDYSTIERLATALGITDVSLLLAFINTGGNEMVQLTERQKSAAKRIYDSCIWFLHEFYNSDGFNSYWFDFKEKGSLDPEDDIYDLIEKLHAKVMLVLDQEYFDLHNCEIYDEFNSFIYEDLYRICSGKVGYAYRFEAKANGNPTTDEDYAKAMTRLNAIIDKYE